MWSQFYDGLLIQAQYVAKTVHINIAKKHKNLEKAVMFWKVWQIYLLCFLFQIVSCCWLCCIYIFCTHRHIFLGRLKLMKSRNFSNVGNKKVVIWMYITKPNVDCCKSCSYTHPHIHNSKWLRQQKKSFSFHFLLNNTVKITDTRKDMDRAMQKQTTNTTLKNATDSTKHVLSCSISAKK